VDCVLRTSGGGWKIACSGISAAAGWLQCRLHVP